MRRSSNAVDISALALASRLGGLSPEKGSRVTIPIGDARVQGIVHLSHAATNASGKRALVENLPEALDQIEPGCGLGKRHEMEAGMPPVPQHRVERPV